jgi:hypothetical protein
VTKQKLFASFYYRLHRQRGVVLEFLECFCSLNLPVKWFSAVNGLFVYLFIDSTRVWTQGLALLGRCSITWGMPPTFINLIIQISIHRCTITETWGM